jgi:hypothetical protein
MADDSTEPEAEGFDPEQAEIGWRVLDPDGNVVASGPLIELEAVSDTGEEQ